VKNIFPLETPYVRLKSGVSRLRGALHDTLRSGYPTTENGERYFKDALRLLESADALLLERNFTEAMAAMASAALVIDSFRMRMTIDLLRVANQAQSERWTYSVAKRLAIKEAGEILLRAEMALENRDIAGAQKAIDEYYEKKQSAGLFGPIPL